MDEADQRMELEERINREGGKGNYIRCAAAGCKRKVAPGTLWCEDHQEEVETQSKATAKDCTANSKFTFSGDYQNRLGEGEEERKKRAGKEVGKNTAGSSLISPKGRDGHRLLQIFDLIKEMEEFEVKITIAERCMQRQGRRKKGNSKKIMKRKK